MRRALIAMMFIGCGACDSSTAVPDAGGPPDATAGPDARNWCATALSSCNPVAGTGCCPNEKCTRLTESEDPLLTRSACVDCGPDGALCGVPEGGACEYGPAGPTTGYDDCAPQLICLEGMCKRICTQAPDSCPDDFVCRPFDNLFDGLEGVGACEVTCSVLEQDCVDGDACYLSLLTGAEYCAPPMSEDGVSPPGRQGDECTSLNTCAEGFGCTLLDHPDMTTGNVCAAFCDASTSAGQLCPSLGGPPLTCVQITMFYGDASSVPDEVGFCVDCELWSDVPGCQ